MSGGLVVSGFGAFHGAADNPSQRVVEYLTEEPGTLPGDTRFVFLDVEYAKVGAWLDALLHDPPAALLLTGYSSAATGLTLESRATGICSPEHPDNAGFVPESEDGEPLDNLHLDLPDMRKRLRGHGLPAAISCDAGSYLCNYSYRKALVAIAANALPTRALFVHLPAIAGTPLANTSAGAMNMDDMARGLAIIAHTMIEGPNTRFR